MARAVCSLIVVNYNGLRLLEDCFRAIESLVYPEGEIDAILVDNGSDDSSIEYVGTHFPATRTFENTENNFAKALNLGIQQARGEYVGFLNNDVAVQAGWLRTLVDLLEASPGAGAAGGKILFPNGRINSTGIRQLPDMFWEDIGFDETDSGQYDAGGEVEGLCWAAVLFRRECLEDVGPIDEDFVMYCEDVDFSARARSRGWRLLYTPDAIAYHAYRGSSGGSRLTEYFCNRNRFLYLAKHAPHMLPWAIRSSHFFKEGRLDLLFECMPITIKKLVESHEARSIEGLLDELCAVLESIYGARALDQLLGRMQVVLGHRKPSIGIYDHALHAIGGGQRYVATLAAGLQRECDVTYLANKPVAVCDLETWYHLDLSRCQVKIISLPFYDEQGRQWIDSGMVTADIENPFEAVAAESRRYDIFINANMLEKVRPLAPLSVFICHFPDTPRRAHFAVDQYSFIVVNSQYTADWLKTRWNLEGDVLVYPPVEMEAPRRDKERIILSVARFEPGGSKKQKELVTAFRRMLATHPEELAGWRLILAGGTLPGNAYLDELRALVDAGPGPIEIVVNGSFTEIQQLYARAPIFWHACGLGETNPQLIEHFGMTTVEAMQNYCAPVVLNGGGQREIVEHGRSGFLFDTVDQLCAQTRELVTRPGLLEAVQREAHERSQRFTRARFEARMEEFFDLVLGEYSRIPLPDPQEVARRMAKR